MFVLTAVKLVWNIPRFPKVFVYWFKSLSFNPFLPLKLSSISITLTKRVFLMLGSDFHSPNPVAHSQLSSSVTQLQSLTHGYSPPMFYVSLSSPLLFFLTDSFPTPMGISSGAWSCNTMFSIAIFLFLSPSSLWSWSHFTPTFGSNSATDIGPVLILDEKYLDNAGLPHCGTISPLCCCTSDTHAKESKQVFYIYFYHAHLVVWGILCMR